MNDDTKSNGKSAPESRRVSLSTPWGRRQSIFALHTCELDTDGEVNEFIQMRTQLHEAYIREQTKSSRLGLVLAFVLILAAAIIVQFAPPGREELSYWIGSALVIFAAGCCGFGRIWGKARGIPFGADRGERSFWSKDAKESGPKGDEK